MDPQNYLAELLFWQISFSKNTENWIQSNATSQDRVQLNKLFKNHLKKKLPKVLLSENKIFLFYKFSDIPDVVEYKKVGTEIRLHFNGLDVSRNSDEMFSKWMKRSFRLDSNSKDVSLINMFISTAYADGDDSVPGSSVAALLAIGSYNDGKPIPYSDTSIDAIRKQLLKEFESRFIDDPDREAKLDKIRTEMLAEIQKGTQFECVDARKKQSGARFQMAAAKTSILVQSMPTTQTDIMSIKLKDKNSAHHAELSIRAADPQNYLIQDLIKNGRKLKVKDSEDARVLSFPSIDAEQISNVTHFAVYATTCCRDDHCRPAIEAAHKAYKHEQKEAAAQNK